MRPEDIGRLISVSDPRLSPDGTTIAFVVTRVDMNANRYRSAVWLAAADGSSAPRQLTAGEEGDSGPTWSPDGRTLAFTSHRKKDDKGDKRSTLHLLAVDRPGETVTLIDLPEGISDVQWSPDGSRVAFVARKRGERWESGDDDASRPPRRIDHFLSRIDSVGWIVDRPTQIWVGPSDGSAPPEPVTEGPHEHGAPVWSPDGSQLAFTAARHDRWDLDRPVNDVWLLDLNVDGTAGDLHQITDSSLNHHHVSWSPDGSRLAALASEEMVAPGLPQLVVIDPESGKSEEPARSLDRSCAPYPGSRSPIWDGDRLWFGVEDGGNVHLYRVPADASGPPERMDRPARNLGLAAVTTPQWRSSMPTAARRRGGSRTAAAPLRRRPGRRRGPPGREPGGRRRACWPATSPCALPSTSVVPRAGTGRHPHSHVPAAALVARTDLLLASGGFDEDLRCGEDVDLVLGGSTRAVCGSATSRPASCTTSPGPRSGPGWPSGRRTGVRPPTSPQRHPGAAPPLAVSGWSAAVWALVAAGAPVAALATAGATALASATSWANLDDPVAEAARTHRHRPPLRRADAGQRHHAGVVARRPGPRHRVEAGPPGTGGGRRRPATPRLACSSGHPSTRCATSCCESSTTPRTASACGEGP